MTHYNHHSYSLLLDNSFNGQFRTLNPCINNNSVFLSSQLTTITRATTTTTTLGHRVVPNTRVLPTYLGFLGNHVRVAEVVRTQEVVHTRLLDHPTVHEGSRAQNPSRYDNILFRNSNDPAVPRPVEYVDSMASIDRTVCDQYDISVESDDGRTHSLPHEKYGPYTCPRCGGVFGTSQVFAAHMGTHYKHESADQRRRRRLAKSLKKKQSAVIKSRKNNGGAIANEGDDREERHAFEVSIKNELVEM